MNTSSQQVPCLVCGAALSLRLARGRKSGKPFVMLLCPADGRHFRAFVNDQPYVKEVLARLEGQPPASSRGGEADTNPAPARRSRTNLERGG